MFGKHSNKGSHRHSFLDKYSSYASPTDDETPPMAEVRMKNIEENDSEKDEDLEDVSMSLFEDDEDENPVENLQDAAAKKTRATLAKGESRAVWYLRWFVLLALLATAVTVTVTVYLYANQVQQDQFVSDFQSVATMTLRSFVDAVESKMAAMDALAAGITSYAISSGSTFPNVTVPDFEIKGASLRTQTDSIFSFWLPLVTDETRAGYEAYSWPLQQHFVQSYMAEEGLRQFQDAYFNISKPAPEAADPNAEQPPAQAAKEQQQRQLHVSPEHKTIHERIWGLDPGVNNTYIVPDGSGPYLPVWQMSPIIPLASLYNYNFLAYYDLEPTMTQSIATGKAVLSYLQTNHTGRDTESLIQTFMKLNQYRHTGENYDENLDPLTQVAYPVFDSFHPLTKNVSGLVVTTIFWRLLLSNILPDAVNGVICVLSNSLGDSITYQIDGRQATIVGVGDLHDDKYTDMGISTDIADYMKEHSTPQSTSFTLVELDTGYTSYSIHVYPSQTMEDNYVTNEPLYYALVIASVFLFTSLVFLCYDLFVRHRHKKVMDKAVKSTAVVTALFPEAVHERLFADAKSDEFKSEMNAWKAASAQMSYDDGREPTVADLMTSTTSNRVTGRQPPALVRNPRGKKGRPIADKFPATTVLFADLAGFTQWSSTREPEHVFILLESLYGAFDKVALRREVFKVETIGDCYMAVTGLPQPQEDHAFRMVKFARDCMSRMARLLDDLATQLGPDTRDLAMRVGLHSGPVTAGVLRGDKGRFQLFGDTVNTASRMESLGVKGRIHCSESTAKLLPEKWLTIREDKVVAKGKGEMTTYFVDAGHGSRSSIGGTSAVGSDNAQNGKGGAHQQEGGAHQQECVADRKIMDASNNTLESINSRKNAAPAIRICTETIPEVDVDDYGTDLSWEDEEEVASKKTKKPEPEPRFSSGRLLTSWGVNLGFRDEIEV